MADREKAATELLDAAIDAVDDLHGDDARLLRNAVERAARRAAAGVIVRAIAAKGQRRQVDASEIGELLRGFERAALEAIESYECALDDVTVARLRALRGAVN